MRKIPFTIQSPLPGNKVEMIRDILYYFKKYGVATSVFNLGFWSLILHRLGHTMNGRIIFKLCLIWYVYILLKSILNLVAKIELPASCKIGRNFSLVHAYGLVMGNKVVIGDNCTAGPWVVFGHNGNPKEQPVIGNNVYIGAHACIFGKVTIGDNVLIGANTVVTRDVPADSIVKAVVEIRPNGSKRTIK